MSVKWDWEDFWAFFETVENVLDKSEMLKQINIEWLRKLSAPNQFEVLRFAPREIVDNTARLRPATLILLRNDKDKIVKRRKRK